jgi:hypothetical protein
MFDLDPRDLTDSRDRYSEDVYDPRWGEDPRDRDERDRDVDARDRDPRDPFVDGLELPRGLERELVQDERENLYELNGENARMLATICAASTRSFCRNTIATGRTVTAGPIGTRPKSRSGRENTSCRTSTATCTCPTSRSNTTSMVASVTRTSRSSRRITAALTARRAPSRVHLLWRWRHRPRRAIQFG